LSEPIITEEQLKQSFRENVLSEKGREVMGSPIPKFTSLKNIVPIEMISEYLHGFSARLRRNRHAVPKMGVEAILRRIEPAELRDKYLAMYEAHPEYDEVPGGAKHHHWWVGGLRDHVLEMIGWMLDQKALYKSDWSGVSETDIIATTFLHDFDKTLAYIRLTEEDRATGKYHEKQEFRGTYNHLMKVDGYTKIWMEAAKFGITLTEDQWSAILFHHGGFSPYHFDFGGTRTYTGDKVFGHNKLAVLLYSADAYSSQVLGGSLV